MSNDKISCALGYMSAQPIADPPACTSMDNAMAYLANLTGSLEEYKQSAVIWTWKDSPAALSALSEHGGDEDGVAWIPAYVDIPWWMERIWIQYGDPQIVDFGDFGRVVIWAH